MLIDWFTVGAQTLNFLVLVWLMKRLLYKPILDALDARESRIASELADADAKRVEAEAERAEFHRKNEDLEGRRATLMKQIKVEAEAERLRLLAEARDAATELSARRREALRAEARSLEDSINDWTRQEVFAMARKTLSDLASTSLEERLVATFMSRIAEMDAASRTRLTEALAANASPAVVRSAFPMTPAQRGAVEEFLQVAATRAVAIRFETAADVISGVELTVGGQKIAWSIDSYLVSLEEGVGEFLKDPLESGPSPGGSTSTTGFATKA